MSRNSFFADNVSIHLDAKVFSSPDFAAKMTAELNDPQTQREMVDEAAKGLESVQILTKTFRDVASLLCIVDRKKYIGRNGEKIREFAPTWKTHHNEFKDLINTCEKFANTSVDTIQLYRSHVLKTLSGTDTLEQKERVVAHFIGILRRENSDAQRRESSRIQTRFSELSSDVKAFHASFITTMEEVGMALDASIQQVGEEIEYLRGKLDCYAKNAKAFGDALQVHKAGGKSARIALGCHAFFHSAATLTPRSLLTSTAAAVSGKQSGKRYREEIDVIQQAIEEQQDKWKQLQADKTQYGKLRPSIEQAAHGIQTVTEKLVVLTEIFKMVYKDCIEVQTHLSHIRQCGQNLNAAESELLIVDIQLASACYSRLAAILDAFSTGSHIEFGRNE